MSDNQINNTEDEMPDEGYFLVEPHALSRVQGGKWLAIDGDIFAVVDWKEQDETESHYIRLHIKKIEGPPVDRDGYIGSFYRQGEEHLGAEEPTSTNQTANA